MAIRLFTWNLQRGATSATAYSGGSDDYKRVNLRYSLLQDLCSKSDFGFIIEPGPNIREAIKNQSPDKPIPEGFCYMDGQTDTQSDLSACRPILYSRKPSRFSIETKVHSGAMSANRFPIGQQYYFGEHKLVVVALHATSGQSGSANAKEIIQSYIDYLPDDDVGGLIVGGDFNCDMATRPQYLPEEPRHPNGKIQCRYAMPLKPTNQGAPTDRPTGIDGFFFYTNHASSRPVEFTVHTPMRYNDVHRGTSEMNTSQEHRNGAGFWLDDEKPEPNGTLYRYRLSDHCPVMLTVALKLMHHDRRSGDVTQTGAQ